MKQILMDQDWKFHLGDINGVRNRWAWGKSGSFNQGPESKGYDDTEWRTVDLPHDFVIESSPVPYMEQEFGKDNVIPEMGTINNIHTAAGSFRKDAGWYRKHFEVEKEKEGKRFFLFFEGMYRDSKVYLNDFFIGKHQSGYAGVTYEITDFLNYGGENVLSVYTDAREAEGWFYEGGGIYRHVWFIEREKDFIQDIFIQSELRKDESGAATAGTGRTDKTEETEETAETESMAKESTAKEQAAKGERNEKEKAKGHGLISISAELECGDIGKNYTIQTIITEMDGGKITEKSKITKESKVAEDCKITEASRTFVLSKKKETVTLQLEAEGIEAWSIENPKQYIAQVQLLKGNQVLDEQQIPFGIRNIRFDAENGFYLNDSHVKIKGVCCHQNHGGIGTAMPDEMYEYRVQKLKEMGCNAIRTSHYPPAKALLDACDRLGMLVMTENRLLSSAKEDLEQLAYLVHLSRNHPSVILYSIGNEEAQSQMTKQGARIAGTMIDVIKQLDPTRPVTMGLLMYDLQHRESIDDCSVLAGISEKLDVAGFNYNDDKWANFHDTYKNQPFVCTELGTFKSTRGCYQTDKENVHLSITDTGYNSYMSGAREWHSCKPPYVSGAFMWTGFDYYGEPTPFAWPAISSQFGIMDLCGFPKDFYYYYQAWWSEKKVVHLFPEWTGTEGEKKTMYLFSNAKEAELFVNGESLGRKKMEEDGYLTWEDVRYQPGTVTAVGYFKDGEKEECLKTHLEAPKKAVIARQKTDFRKGRLLIVNVSLEDEDGRLATGDDREVEFKVIGGKILGTCSGDPHDHVAPHSAKRLTFHGLVQAVIWMDTEDGADEVVVTAKGLPVQKA